MDMDSFTISHTHDGIIKLSSQDSLLFLNSLSTG